MYSEQVLQHFQRPHNVGEIESADGLGRATGGARCPEDLVYIWIRVIDGRIVEIKHKTRGCPVAIAASSITTDMALGKTLEEAAGITEEAVAAALGDLPERKLDSIAAPAALRAAIADYESKRK